MSVVIPFGKYKGSEIETLRDTDPQYLDWLSAQPDLKEKWPEVAAAITDRGGEISPVHNTLQAQFLKCDLCTRLMHCLGVPTTEKIAWSGAGEVERLRRNLSITEWIQEGRDGEYPTRSRGPGEGPCVGVELPRKFWRVFEQDFDVVLSCDAPDGNAKTEICVECKPTIGDDYPAVLRQVTQQAKRRRARFVTRVGSYGDYREHYQGPKRSIAVVYGTLKSESVPVNDIKKIFVESGNIRLVSIEELGGTVPVYRPPQPTFIPDFTEPP